ncbi:MAG TPA: di-heme oxidoredictase family protein [Polyangiaceae bacterium]|nr:di-heme oxidoredictase family protein [Polyangiaceae bacterium]
MSQRASAIALGLIALGCQCSGRTATAAAGTATVTDATRDAFSLPAPSLTKEHRAQFFVGNSLFNRSWVVAPASLDSRDGLGPLFNARSCSGCHFKDGRGRPPEPGEAMRTMLLRVSIPGRGPHGAPLPDPTYGDQIQGNANSGVPPEGNVVVRYFPVRGVFADGQPYALLKPEYRIEHSGYGEPSAELLVSPRVAPAIIGLGLLEAVPERVVREREDPDDENHDGISGRANLVWDVRRGALSLGRFGWKAEQPTVEQQSAVAFNSDLGVTSSLFPDEGCTLAELRCREQPNGGAPEVSDELLRDIVLYARTLGVPARRISDEAAARQGEALFERVGCVACHTTTLRTGEFRAVAELSGQEIHPYTDLLLHDLGEGLADQRPSFRADGREWRTAPLWGLGLVRAVNEHTRLLHDGRARDVTEAILWHEGEARSSRDTFLRMNRDERRALVAFLDTL